MEQNYSQSWINDRDMQGLSINVFGDKNVINPFAANKILNAVSKVINIVHKNNNYVVRFRVKDESYTNFGSNEIVITSKFLNQLDVMTIYDVIDLETGIALHESGHAEYTFTKKGIKQKEAMSNNIKHNIHNIIEDAFIEEIISRNFPGFRGYFEKLRNHYFKDPSIKKTGNLLPDRIIEFLIGLRYFGTPIITDDNVKKSIELVNKELLGNNLINVDRFKLTENVYEILIEDVNKNKNPIDVDKIMEQILNSTDDEIGDNDNPNTLITIEIAEDEIDDNENSNSGSSGDSNNSSGNVVDLSDEEIGGELKEFNDEVKNENEGGLTQSESDMVDSVRDSNMEETEYTVDALGIKAKLNICKCKPKETNRTKNLYKKYLNEMRPLILNFRNKFSDANTIYRQNSYGLSSGMLDDDSLYSAKFNRNIFYNKNIENMGRTKNVDIAFVIDCSGSMETPLQRASSKRESITRMDAAKRLATLFVESLDPIRSVNSWVFGFQDSRAYVNNELSSNNCWEDVMKIRESFRGSTHMLCCYEPNMKTKSKISTLTPDGMTPEIDALRFTIDELSNRGRKEAKKVIVMLTDGEPSKPGLRHSDHVKLIKHFSNQCDKKDISIIHLALTSEAEKSPYKNKIQWQSKLQYKGLVEAFIKMLKKEIS